MAGQLDREAAESMMAAAERVPLEKLDFSDLHEYISPLALWGLVAALLLLVVFLVVLPGRAWGDGEGGVFSFFSGDDRPPQDRAQVLVLGDIGRSPRMQNQALSIARTGVLVDLIGYLDSEVHPLIQRHKNIKLHGISRSPKSLQTDNKLLFLVFGPLKAIHQFWSLWNVLGHRTKPARWLLVQNPPSIPTLMVASMICWCRKTQLAIDWHNFGYSILALKLGRKHIMVRASYAYEEWFARSADLIFTVSDAMSRQLKREFKPFAPVKRLHDRPTSDFRPVTKEERTEFLEDMDLPENQTVSLEKGKLKVLVSSTSWTPDEDFSMLLDALVGYSSTRGGNPNLPELLVIITGKGPQKGYYLKRIAELEKSGKLKDVSIKTAWLPTFAYARLLASADLGISLHQSSSGVDLPMKVVDMFGAGLPVAGYSSYESWPELVKEGVTGRGFSTTEELQAVLTQLLSDDGTKLARLRDQVLAERERSWDKEWAEVAAPAMGYTTEAQTEQQAEQPDSA